MVKAHERGTTLKMKREQKEKLIDGVLNYRCHTCKNFYEKELFYYTSKHFIIRKNYQCKVCHKSKVKESYLKTDGKLRQRIRYNSFTPEKKKAHSEECKSRYWDNIPKTIWENAKDRATRNNIEFTIIIEDIIVPKLCPLLNVPFKPGTKENKWYTWSLDRIDTTKGYTKDNIQVITYLANTMKNKASKKELISFATNILKLMT